MYGLKQSPKNFYKYLKEQLQEINFQTNDAFPCIYQHKELPIQCYTFVDDIIILAENQQLIKDTIKQLQSKFKLKILEPKRTENPTGYSLIRKILGIRITENYNLYDEYENITIDLQDYSELLVEQYLNNPNVKSKTSPPTTYITSKYNIQNESDHLNKINTVRQIIGKLIFLSTQCRPDLQFSVNYISRFNLNHPLKYSTTLKESSAT